MANNRLINSLSYLSILFLPVLFPLIVWLMTGNNPDAHRTAGRAFWLHLLPTILMIIFLIIFGISGFYLNDVVKSGWIAIIVLPVLALIAIASYLWSLIRGIQYLLAS
ncbi:DUF4870 domain-containing protein [Lactiplantibacillus modestisalitolerans]|uniref:DUF4870 domain-containing protein n=1 Tax=Lactiplantibacillus modestisalitolerans TaxID=1457219 RepID=A0ABV5WS55_9LACO|nr:DUF4870 domain-containing protein [Lactiplantibacillus modestisalitolerans]